VEENRGMKVVVDLLIMVAGGIIGGLLGSMLRQKLHRKKKEKEES
jgi:uncharacterized membrane protein YfcA